MKQIFQFDRYFSSLKSMFDISDFALPMQAWNARREVIFGVILASFLINVLALAFPLALLQIYDRIIPNVAIHTLVLLVLGVGIALILEAVLRISRAYVSAWADAKFEHIVGCKSFRHMLNASILEFEEASSAKNIGRLNAIDTLRDFYSGQAIVSLVDLPFIFILLFLVGYIGGFLVFVPISMLLIYFFSSLKNIDRLKKILDARQDQDEKRSNFIIETLSNIHTVKSVSLEAQIQREYEHLQKITAYDDHNVGVGAAKIIGVSMTMTQLTIIAVIAIGSIMVIHGGLTIGGLAACTLFSGRCLQPINMIVSLWSRFQSIKIAKKNLEKVLEMKPENMNASQEMGVFKGGFEFQNVTFRYSEESGWVHRHINLKVNPKEVIGISGKNLGGRSTLMWLLMGMLQPTFGKILLDGKDAVTFSPRSYRKKIAYLPEQSVLFKGTILENLTLFDEERYYKPAMQIAKMIGLSEIIGRLPNGYQTIVGAHVTEDLPHGVNQRIVIARALLCQPSIIIFDKANVSMDMQGEQIIKEIIKKLVGKCTLILISHNTSILSLAHRQFVMEDAELREK